jgi:ferredoxin
MIFYFSGTGNSEYTAREIAEELGEEAMAVGDCLRDNRLSFSLKDDERVGFIFPVYFYGVPNLVLDLIGRLDLQHYRDHYTWSVCTCGGDSGNVQAMLRKSLAGRGIRLDAAFEVEMPDNYILMFDLLTPADKAAALLRAAEGSIAATARNIRDRKRVPVVSNPIRWAKTVFAYPFYKHGRNTGRFYALADCNGCGLCARVCPCSMIEMQKRLPVWKAGKCTQCLACLHRCPKRAIQYGRKTESRGRYVNPNLK